MAVRSMIQDKNGNAIGIRKEGKNSYQIIFDNYDQEFWIEFDEFGLEYFLEKANEIMKEKDY